MFNKFHPTALAVLMPCVLSTLATLSAFVPGASAQDKLWIEQFGSIMPDIAHALARDAAGGAYVAGYTKGSLGGPSAGGDDAFVARHDENGGQLWVRQFGVNGETQARALAPDAVSGVFVAGYTLGSLGSPSSGQRDVFIARYDAGGTQLWIRQFGTSENDYAYALAPDGVGGVFVAGYTWGSLRGMNAGERDAFIARFDADGTQLWLRQFGTPEEDQAWALTPDGSGGVVVAGWTRGSLSGLNAGGRDVFYARYDADGNQLWIRQFGTSEWDIALAVATDGAGGVMVAGRTEGSLGAANIGGRDAYIARYGADGTQLWVRQFGTNEDEQAHALATDGAGGVMVAGSTEGSLGGPNAGSEDVFVAQYDADGTQLWIRQFGEFGQDSGWAAAPDGAGGVIVAGPTAGSLGAPNAGSLDVFLARYGDSCYADCDTSGSLDIFDFLCFQDAFVMMDPYADCDGNSAFDIFDFLCFQDAFVTGCP
jgi:hypothetical protein